ncbi:MAG: RNA-guided pseudouridylation complex pseudouridine synthase subunit Cbf5 [Conexivisphaera sp.]
MDFPPGRRIRDWLVESTAVVGEESEGEYGKEPEDRPTRELLEYGLIPVDKPAGQTSHQVTAWVKRMLGVERAGHSGTLDPLATGLLPVATGRATKVLQALLLGPKEYYSVMRLHDPVPDDQLRAVVSEFTGPIYQRPPVRSRVKRERRIRNVYELEIVERKGNLVLLRSLVQAGTYIRKLIYDMGEVLGPGATMVELRRTRVCNLTERDHLVRLHDLAYAARAWKDGDDSELRKLVLPIEAGMTHLKPVVAKDSAVDAVAHGSYLAAPGIARMHPGIVKGDVVAIFTNKGELVAIASAQMGYEEVEELGRGIAMKPLRVVMPPGIYPRSWRSRGERGEGEHGPGQGGEPGPREPPGP